MSVIVRGMEMPKNCIECGLQFGGFCFAKPPEIEDERVAETPAEAAEQKYPEWCPLVELPEKHGRLIDGDMLKAEIEEMAGYDEAEQFNDYYLCEQPVIMEAEGLE